MRRLYCLQAPGEVVLPGRARQPHLAFQVVCTAYPRFELVREVNAMSDETSPMSEPVETLMTRVFALVRACPVGRVTTYGWLAKAVGYPRGARMVGWIMNETPEGVPAHRVINSKVELSGGWACGQKQRIRQLLEAECIVFSDDGVD